MCNPIWVGRHKCGKLFTSLKPNTLSCREAPLQTSSGSLRKEQEATFTLESSIIVTGKLVRQRFNFNHDLGTP